MSSSRYYADLISRVYVEADLVDSPRFQALRPRLACFPIHIVASKEEIPNRHLNQRTVFLCRPRGETVGSCPGSRGHICCNYLTADLYLGCPLGCAYCIMKSYLNFAPLTVYLDPGPTIARIIAIAGRNPDRMLRVGTGEVGDSLLLDPIFGLSAELIGALADFPNVYLELKTKTHFVDHLLDIDGKGNTVIGFSLNPQSIITAYEGSSSPLRLRLDAARRALEAGYLVSFHFDPLIYYPEWERDYRGVIEKIFERIDGKGIIWISLGGFRFPPYLKPIIRNRFPASKILWGELFPGNDVKFRYLKSLRVEMYRKIVGWLRDYEPNLFIYLCMESREVWEKVFGWSPKNNKALDGLFAQRVRSFSPAYQ